MRLRRALLRQRGVHKIRESDGHLKRSGMTREEFNFYQREVKWFRSATLADNTCKPGSKVLLDCSRSRVYCTRQNSVQYLYYQSRYKGYDSTHVTGADSMHQQCSDT